MGLLLAGFLNRKAGIRGFVFGIALLGAGLSVLMAGCSSGSSAKAGAISINGTNGPGASPSLAVATTAQLSMAGSNAPAGVDWTVTCGGSPVTGSLTGGACGSFSSAHTVSGASTTFTAPGLVPIGTTVMISASLTNNPSQSSSVMVTITTAAVAVKITGLGSTVVAGGKLSATAVLTNDSVGAGVNWSLACGGSADCGSVTTGVPNLNNYFATYTAPAAVPAGGTVTVTATSVTDPTKSASQVVTITAPPPAAPPISITIAPSGPYYVETSGAAAARTVSIAAWVANDSANKGVDWKITCQSTSCGLLQVSHTASGTATKFQGPTAVPTGGTVTITASSTADSTQSATATIQVETTTAPIAITIAPAPPATMIVGAQSTLSASVAGDTDSLGVDWTATCGSVGACGSFSLSPAHTASGGTISFTAPSSIPAGKTVLITATSPATTAANGAAVQTTIVAQPASVSFIQEPPATLTATDRTTVSAVVANDATSGGGITWTLQCGSTAPGGCGTVIPYQTPDGIPTTYTAPPVKTTGTTVTIIATSTADSTKSASSPPLAIVPSTQRTIGFVPFTPTQMQANSTATLNAAVNNDGGDQGVDWQVCTRGCGFFTTKAAVAEIPATATTPYVPAMPAVTATTVMGWPNGLPLPYTAPAQQPDSGPVTIAIAAHADGSVSSTAQIAVTGNTGGPDLHGRVMAATLPVYGASVSLYAASTSGYGTQSLPLHAQNNPPSVITDASGNFTIPGGYTCPSSTSQVYLVATGGTSGTNTQANNALAMMTALGSCSSVSGTPVVINEVTTVGSVWPLAPFAANEPLVGNTNYLYIGTSSGNTSGLANAFATVNNLVDVASGKVRYSVPSGNADVPYAEINTLADMLNVCTSTTGGVEGDNTPCGSFLNWVDPLGHNPDFNPTSPTDTLQGAFNLAQLHVVGGDYIFDNNSLLGSVSPASPFQPIVGTVASTGGYPNWPLSLTYTGGGGINSASTVGSFAVDASGNLWITDTNSGTVDEWNTTGAAVAPTGYTAGGGRVAVDVSGNVWVSGDGRLTELNGIGTPVPGSPYPGVTGGGTDIAFDGFGNLWISTTQGVAEFNGFGLELSPTNGYVIDGFSDFSSVAVDGSNHVRALGATVQNASPEWALADLFDSSGQLVFTPQTAAASRGGAPGFPPTIPGPQMAFTNSGTLWYTSWTQYPTGAGTGIIGSYGSYQGVGTFPTVGGYSSISTSDLQGISTMVDPGGVAVDGAGTLWFANGGGLFVGTFGQTANVQPNIIGIPSTSNGGLPQMISCTATSPQTPPLRMAIDRSGNVWVLQQNNTVNEYIGAAVPAITPLASAVASNKLGAKP